MATIQWLPKASKISPNQIVLNPAPLTAFETAAAAGAVGGTPGARRLAFSASSRVTTAAVNTPVNASGFVRVEMVDGFRVVPDQPDEKPPGALIKYFATASGSTERSVGVSYDLVFVPRVFFPLTIVVTSSKANTGPSFDGVAALFTRGEGVAVELARASISDGIVVPPALAGKHLFSSLGVSPAVPLNFGQTYFLAAVLNASASCGAVAVRPSHVGADQTMASAEVDGSTAARDGAYPTILLTAPPIIPPGGAGDEDEEGNEEDGGGN